MGIAFGRAECGELAIAEQREWLVTNGTGSFAAGTIAGLLTRRYHGLLIAALNPPLGRTLLVSKVDTSIQYGGHTFPLFTNRWADQTIDPHGYLHLEQFHLEGTTPVWSYACADVRLEQRIWMEPGQNTTYIRYSVRHASEPVALTLKPFVNYRDFHGDTHTDDWPMEITPHDQGLQITAFQGATPFALVMTSEGTAPQWSIRPAWHQDFDLAQERYRGLTDAEDHLNPALVSVTLQTGESCTLILTTNANPDLNITAAWERRTTYEREVLEPWRSLPLPHRSEIEPLILAADQFIVARSLPDQPDGKTVIAGYPWFGDWGRDTMISLPGLTLSTERPAIARQLLRTFAQYLDHGMLPNLFPDGTNAPQYNTVDAILWYFEALRAYYTHTEDQDLIAELFPALVEVIDWHIHGTRYSIKVDPKDGLLYAGEPGEQLTWMDAKVDDWVVTPRIGKPIEVNALWYNALVIMQYFGQLLGEPVQVYQEMAQQTVIGFNRFWNYQTGYCFDVLDTPTGNDSTLRPNQIFAVSLPSQLSAIGGLPLLLPREQKLIVDTVARSLLTSHGLRSLAPNHPDYVGIYGGDRLQRDGSYHQGTVWGWLLGHYVQAHLAVYGDRAQAQALLTPMLHHLNAACVGSLSEIFDGDAPFTPRGAIAQAWTVAEVLRVWRVLATH
ncbi:amylo-alpha-1,6-glucosidase [Spirulina major]|uniref:amylo-alpha-1,6-glucosidase n=1 Tax=Spirulina major TaxID=270636 RepID=UPI0009353D04|nr:amylo-alpha-1,6-glucosidase [Spirulina major]